MNEFESIYIQCPSTFQKCVKCSCAYPAFDFVFFFSWERLFKNVCRFLLSTTRIEREFDVPFASVSFMTTTSKSLYTKDEHFITLEWTRAHTENSPACVWQKSTKLWHPIKKALRYRVSAFWMQLKGLLRFWIPLNLAHSIFADEFYWDSSKCEIEIEKAKKE